LRAVGVPAVARLRPGRAPDELNALVARLGFQLPQEALTWWGWHDGTTVDAPDAERSLVPGGAFLSLQEAIERANWWRAFFDDLPLGQRWKREWLPLEDSQEPVIIDCAAPPDTSARARFVAADLDWEWPDGVGVPSMGRMVQEYIRALDIGHWTYDKSQGWQVNPEKRSQTSLGLL
jgi:hypothetical protein